MSLDAVRTYLLYDDLITTNTKNSRNFTARMTEVKGIKQKRYKIRCIFRVSTHRFVASIGHLGYN